MPEMRARKPIVVGVLAVAVLAGIGLAVYYRPQLVGLPPRAPDVPVSALAVTHQGAPYKIDAVELYLIPTQRVEYKFQLAEGATMVYTWKSEFPVYFDMHNVPDGRPITDSQRIEEGTTAAAHGVYTAPYPGLHGWYWENRGEEGVLITLQAAGFFTRAVMISDGEQIPMEIRDPPPAEVPQ